MGGRLAGTRRSAGSLEAGALGVDLTLSGNATALRFLGSSLGTPADPTFSWVAAANDGTYNGGNGVFFSAASVARARANDHALGSLNGMPLSGAGRFVLENIITANIAANQNNYAPAGYGNVAILLLTPDAARVLTGFGAPTDTGVEVAGLVLVSNEATVAGRTLTLNHEDALSDPGNRFTCPLAANAVIAAGGLAILRRVGNAATGRWNVRVLA